MWDRHQKARLNEARREDLAALRLVYAAELPERLRAIEVATGSLRDNGWDPRVAASLYDMAHRLAGSAAIYGFPEVSEAAVKVGAFGNGPGAPDRAVIDSAPLLRLAATLASALRHAMAQVDHGTRPQA
jgi:HPt (histidine-containing phosphotransfer) domain-containing protein